MSAIKVGFSKSGSLISKLVRFFSRSDISHTWLLLEDLVGGIDLVMEAVPGGFHIITYERFVRENQVIDVVDLNTTYSESSLRRAFGWMGKRYDYLTVFGMMWVLFGRFFGKKWKNPLSSKSIDCVESIVYFLRSNNAGRAHEIDPGSMTPKDLYDHLKQ